ncbi:MAG: hypothetical protein EAZ91_10875 [Cytophagales bacterium]|nr:MAG: hypothetical protein EAZ91_10875 [Cytophagales bacterium]
MKTIRLAVFILGTLIALQAAAQNNPRPGRADRREQLMNSTPEERANRQTQQMKKELALTAEQEKSIAVINLNYARQMQPVIDQVKRDRTTMKQVRQMNNAKEKDLRKVLTDKQFLDYESHKDERRERMKERRG